MLFLCEFASLNGGERSMLATLDAVRAGGFHVRVAAPPAGPLADALAARGVEVAAFQTRDERGAAFSLARRRDTLASLIRDCRARLLHANSLAMSRLAGPVCRQLGVASIGHLRDIVRVSRAAMEDLNCHSRLLAVSRATRQWHVAAGLDAARTHVVYNGVDLEQFHPAAPTGSLHRELGLPPDAMLIGTIGQIGVRKGLDVLVRAARRVAADVPQAHFLVVGERFSHKDEVLRLESQLRAAATSGELAGRLHLLGRSDDVPRLLAELVALAHPARQEPLGRVLLEASAAGVAIVATNVGGTPEIFPGERPAALLVPPDDADSLAAALVRVCRDRPLRQRLQTAARLRAQQAFDIRTAASALIEQYRRVLRDRVT